MHLLIQVSQNTGAGRTLINEKLDPDTTDKKKGRFWRLNGFPTFWKETDLE